MAQIALPRQQVTQAPQSTAVGSPLYQRRGASNAGPIELIPNPEFVFPQRDPQEQLSQSAPASNSRPMSLQSYPAGRRGSTPSSRQKSVSALPDFSFNPSAASTTTAASSLATPPHSPTLSTTPTTPSRPVGHRRGGSEFIGGDGRAGGLTLLSSSPTKSDAILPPPSGALRPGPPAGRRGHAHRRSGAVSSHDLSSIMNPTTAGANPRSGSAPVTPMEGEPFTFGHSVNKSVSQPSLRDTSFFPDDSNSSPRRPPSRARVGFSDKVEYIRPLSTISSETETSLSTVRGHSATGSISSVISAGTASPQSGRTGRPSLNITLEEGRPSTAGAVLDKQQIANFGADLLNRKRPMSAISPASPTVTSPNSPRVPSKRRGFFRLESRRSDTSVPTLHTSLSDPQLSSPTASPLPSPKPVAEDGLGGDAETTKPASRKASRKPRKVKSWANSFISRKGKHSSKSKGSATPRSLETEIDAEDTDVSEELDFDLSFDVDNTVTIVSPTESTSNGQKVTTDIASWKPRELKRVDSDVMSPVIDLDAALGPFNTPQGPSQRSQQRGFAAHRRAMHSASGLVQNHRRTESAPALVPFELRSSVAAKTSTMADVFEEEEPEDDATASRSSKASSQHSPDTKAAAAEDSEEPKIEVVETDHSNPGSTIKWDFEDGLKIQRGEKARRHRSSERLSPRGVPEAVPIVPSDFAPHPSPHVSPVEVVEDYEEPRTSSLTHSSDSTVTPQIPGDEVKESQPVMSLALPLPQQTLMTPDTFTSSFSSPDFRSSQASLETPRLGTSASSVTDYRAMPSPHFGEPGPEVRVSTDVPSLTSSRSTATNAYPPPNYRITGDRSASLCSIPSDVESRRRKRSSIASLSRLINGSTFGERSKLFIEQRPQSEYLEPAKESKKKHKRLSKLMQFWKSKDGSKA